MKATFYSPLRGISKIKDGMTSHNSGWYLTWARILEENGYEVDIWPEKGLSEYDEVFVAHSVDTETQVLNEGFSLNLFGGANSDNSSKLAVLSRTDVNWRSLYIQCPDYGKAAKGRLTSCSNMWASINWDMISKVCNNMPSFLLSDVKSDHLIIGDSHSFSAWVPGATLDRRDGTTLFGVLKNSLNSFLPESYSKYTIYLGNIDIRHHLARQNDPDKAVKELANEYINQASKYADKYQCDIELVTLLPVEDESRKIPKTGWYKALNENGKKEPRPFWGDRETRQKLVNAFNNLLNSIDHPRITVYNWPKEWYSNTESNPKWFFEKMEKPRSVHLAPANYRSFREQEKDSGLSFLF